MRQVALFIALVLGVPIPAVGAVNADPWVLWTRDTQFKDHLPARHWRTDNWIVRGGPFGTRDECGRRMTEQLNSAAYWLGGEYRVTAVLEVSLVARQQRDGTSGLRRRYMCLPASVAPPR